MAASPPSFTRRRVVVTAVSLCLGVVVVVGFGHAGAHVLQNAVVPGLGWYERGLLLALLVFAVTTAVVVLWVQWGVDWLAALTVVGSSVAAGAFGNVPGPVAETAATAMRGLPAAHEFPLVVLVVTGIVWSRGVLGRLPGVGRLLRRRAERAPDASMAALSTVDRSRAAAIAALSDPHDPSAVDGALDADVARRARRIGLLARARRGAEPFEVDHAAPRAALALTGQLSADGLRRFHDDAVGAAAGVPASEPTWLRPLDATLAAAALTTAGHRDIGDAWAGMLAGPLALRRGHRPACWWTPLGIRIGSAPVWEHAATTAIARTQGWCGDDDWAALRPQLLGAAARGSGIAHDERAIAAGRLWLVHVRDEQAARILARPTVQRDALAVALDRLATRLASQQKDLVS
jgi:hypothetical protein